MINIVVSVFQKLNMKDENFILIKNLNFLCNFHTKNINLSIP